MDNEANILISLAARHADKIFVGSKLVELRRRKMHVEPGTTVWIYVTLPVGAIVGKVKIAEVHTSSPELLWSRFGDFSGLNRSEFFDYFEGLNQGTALVLDNAERLQYPYSLTALRKIAEGFHPPQFFKRLTTQHPLLIAVSADDQASTDWSTRKIA
jgi:predicted transcriptional regulator